MKRNLVLTLSLITLTVLLNSCNNDSANYDYLTSDKFLLEFDPLAKYDTLDYFYIDDFKIQHDLRYDLTEVISGNTVHIYPTNYLFFASEGGDRKTQKTSAFEISFALGQCISKLKDDKGNPIYKLENLNAWRVMGKLSFKREDGKPIELKIPKDYPLFVEKDY